MQDNSTSAFSRTTASLSFLEMLGEYSLHTAVIRHRYTKHGDVAHDLCLFDSYPMSYVWGRSMETMQKQSGQSDICGSALQLVPIQLQMSPRKCLKLSMEAPLKIRSNS